MEEQILHALAATRARLESLNPDDKEEIVQIGAAIEQFLDELPEDLADLADLTGRCLQTLQMLYEDTAPDRAQLKAALASVASAIESALTVDTGRESLIASAGQMLWLAMGNDPSECPYVATQEPQQPSDAPDNAPTLDDAAALLVQLDQADMEGLERLRHILCQLSNGWLPSAAQALVLRALTGVETLAGGKSDDPPAALQSVGAFIQQAIDAMDDLEMVESGHADKTSEPQQDECEIISLGNAEHFRSLRGEHDSAAEQSRECSCRDCVAESIDDATASEEEVAQEKSEQPYGDEAEYLPKDTDVALMGEFITECREYIEAAEAALLALETNPTDASSLDTVFRAFHTIKGTSAFLGLNRMSDLAHRAESLLSRMRDGEITCTGIYADLALRSTDMLTELLRGVQDALKGEPMLCPEGLAALANALANPDAGAPAQPDDTKKTANRANQTEEVSSEPLPAEQRSGRGRRASDADAADSVRIRTDRLDKMIDMVGELVIAHSMVGQDETVALGVKQDLTKKVIHLGKIVRDLQYLAMSMRMVPLKPTFQKMARLARDVARKSGKTVAFVTEGEDTEIDRNMVDVISVPLVHMVRNAVDHGIEAPEDREAKGKPISGTVTLSAFHSGGNVIVTMHDDGKGLDRAKIVEKAIAKGLIESDKGMSDGDVYNLIFEPGFSTADRVTDVSGRGVGLDAVKKGVEALRGRVEITSEPGVGCTFSLQLPLTMAVTDGMLVRVGAERFIIPTINIRVSFRPDASDLYTVVGRGEMVTLRGEPIPIVRLHRLFGIDGAVDDPTRALLVVLEDGDHPCALLVDELLGQQHVVAKSLGDGVGQVGGISGGAILGDGRVGLIVDPSKIAALARQASGELDLSELCGLAA